MPLGAGSKLGPYEILSLLGVGGMGEVYRARDTRLDREVAIKVLPAERMADENHRRRLVKEAQSVAALNHPNIVTIHEIESADGIDFIVMEYVPGKTLDTLIPRQGLRLEEVLRIATPIADALARAHAAGIVHRDLKPANVMVGPEGVVKVLDFGLAKVLAPARSPDDPTVSDVGKLGPLSRPGMVAGTAGYMSPEQATARVVDARSDVFSFGAVLYEMVTGRRAFAGASTAETLAAVVRDQPKPPSEVVARVPKELDRLVERCLRKEPDRRVQHMLDVKLELEQIREETKSGLAVVVPSARRRRWWLAAGIAAALGLALATWRLAIPQRTMAAPRVVQLTSLRGFTQNPTFSPDGEQLAFAWQGERQDNWDLYLKMVDSPEVRRLTTDGAADVSPSWSPDGRNIAYLRLPPGQTRDSDNGAGTIHLVSPLGASDLRLSDFRAAGSWWGVIALSWTPDSRWLAVTRLDGGSKPQPGGISLVPAQGGPARALTSPLAPGENHVNGAFSPDGRHFSYLSCLAWFQCQVEVIDLGPDLVPRGSARPLTQRDLCYLGHPVWTRDGRSIVYSSCVDDMLWRIGSAGDPPAERIELAGFNALWPTAAVSRDRIAFKRERGGTDIYRLDGGGPPQPVLASSVADCCASLSADGRRVAFASTRSRDLGIWVADADFSNAMPLTHGLQGGSPRWSPDGRTIAFDSRGDDAHYDLWTIDADGGSPRHLTRDPGDENLPSWSRDGRYVYFAATRGGSTDVWRIAATGGAEERITRHGGQLAIESLDGKTLFFKRGGLTSDRAALFALPLGGGPERQLVDCVLTFAVANRGVYHFGCREDEAPGRPLYLLDPTTGRSQLLGRLERATGDLTVSSDGKTILYPRRRDEGSDLMMIENFR